MSYFKVLLSDLVQTCQDLEQIKAEHTKDHEQISRSFERTLLSILKQEQTILTLVEEEHRRLKDQLSSVQKANELALQNGVFEINTMVHEISTISSQLKQMLATSSDSDPVVKEIQKRVATIFARKKSINVRLQKVHFTPHPLMSLSLGEINCEGQSLGFSIPCLKPNGQAQSDLSGSALLLNETPPWEEISQSSDDAGCVSVKIILADDSDQDSVSSTKGPETGVRVHKPVNTSPREQAVTEADSAALSPRTATKIWISDIKKSPSRQSRSTGIRGGKVQRVLKEGQSMTLKSDSSTTTHLHKESQVLKGLTMAVTSASGEKNITNARSTKTQDTIKSKDIQTPQQPMNSTAVPINSHTPLSRTGHQYEGKVVRNPGSTVFRVPKISPHKNGLQGTPHSCRTSISQNDLQNGHLLTHVPDHETVFKATATYVCDNSSDEGLEERPRERDPKTCREEAIRVSRVPSAKKESDGDHAARWMSVDVSNCTDSNDEIHSTRSYQNTQHKPYGSTTDPPLSSTPEDNKLASECPPRPPSPAESVQSSYTFIIDSPRRRDATDDAHKPRSFFRLASKDTSKGRPVISATDASSLNIAHALKPKQHRRVQSAGSLPGSQYQGITPNYRNRRTVQGTSALRSASLPYIERLSRQCKSRPHRPLSASDRRDSSSSASSCWSNPRTLVSSAPPGSSRVYGRLSQNRMKSARSSRERLTYKVDGFSKSESNLLDCKRVNSEKPKGLVRQFGKFGSGRAELNLPHGLYATKAGSLYVVDYGNRRLQIMNPRGKILQQIALEAKNYFDVAVSNRGLVALTNSTDRTVEVYNKHGRLLQVISKNFGAPRGITTDYQDEFVVADMKLGTVCTLNLHPVTGCQKESTIIPGFNKPYLLASNSQGLLAITERGLDGGCCVKVLGEDWQILKILGLKETPGPKLCNPWGVCIDSEGGVLVADWGNTHSIVYYPPKRPAKVLVSEGLSSPRGLALWQDTLLLVADSMHNCIKVFQYQDMDM